MVSTQTIRFIEMIKFKSVIFDPRPTIARQIVEHKADKRIEE
jgi:hypothetical protein